MMKMMCALKLIACAVFYLTLTIRPTSASQRVREMDTLLKKQFWAPLINGPNYEIHYMSERWVKVREIFERSDLYGGMIVNEFNVNDKVRLYYYLLTIVCADAMYGYLNYFTQLKIKYPLGFTWRKHHLKRHVVEIIMHCRIVYTLMEDALKFVRNMYVTRFDENGNPVYIDWLVFNLDRENHLQYLKNVSFQTDDNIYENLDTMLNAIYGFVSSKRHIVKWIRIGNDINLIQNHLDVLVGLDCTDEQRIKHSKEFLDDMNEQVLCRFQEIGFEYNVLTTSVRLIQD